MLLHTVHAKHQKLYKLTRSDTTPPPKYTNDIQLTVYPKDSDKLRLPENTELLPYRNATAHVHVV